MFKKIALLGLVALAFSCAEDKKEGYALNATFNDAVNGKSVKILKSDGTKQEVIDSTTVTEGQATFEGVVDTPDIYFIQIDEVRGSIPFILENEEMTVSINTDSLINTRIQGSKENDVFNSYQEYMMDFQKQGQAISQEFRAAQQSQDTAVIADVQERYMGLMEAKLDYDLEFVKTNNDAVISALVLGNLLGAPQLSYEDKKAAYDNFTEELKATRAAQTVDESLKAESAVAIGSVVEDFSGPTPEGKTISLNEIKGKVTIIDFWAAWCGPCRRENPNLVNVYNKYHDKGLEVIGVSLDGTPRQQDAKAEWLAAIEKDGLVWHQVSNLNYFNDPIAKQFNIRSIPATFIIDAEGKIVASGLRGQELDNKIGELLN